VIENPWYDLRPISPFVLREDEDDVLAFNEKQHQKANQDHLLHLDFIPEPFVGRPDAPVLLLGNNPGIEDRETAAYKLTPVFASRMRNNLLHRLSAEYPFLYLDPDPNINPPDKLWWKHKLKRLLKKFGPAHLAHSILAVEFFPYMSHRYGVDSLPVPSQEYSFSLVRNAMDRGAVIVLTRGKRRWMRKIPKLRAHPRLVTLIEVQKAPVSPGNCSGAGYQEIERAIEETTTTCCA
jgi:hypothetical protein